MTLQSKFEPKQSVKLSILLSISLLMTACNLHTRDVANDGIGYREARFAEISAMREYRKCRDDALELDTKARKESSTARYLASARLLEKCESELGAEAASAGEEERLRAYALSVQNYFKGGDISQARKNLEKLQKAFPEKDLYWPDGSSFIETMEVILGLKDNPSIGAYSVANVNYDLKAELRRIHYWKKN